MLGTSIRSLRVLARARPLVCRALPSISSSSSVSRTSRVFSSKASMLESHDTFARRHIGPMTKDLDHMLKVVGVETLDKLIDITVPDKIRQKKPLDLPPSKGESAALAELKEIMSKNIVARSHIGMGYYDTITPPVILRNMLENPGWYTPYTPYQPEISQGRLEMLLNYQTMVMDLTGMPVANASLLDEGTAAAEAMNMLRAPKKCFLIADHVHPQTIAVIKTRAEALDTEVRVCPVSEFDFSKEDVAGVLMQYPATDGSLIPMEDICEKAHMGGAKVVIASDLLALTVLKPPGEFGADVVVGSAQRFGVPMGFGGPHAAFFCTTESFKRKMPGRVIGVSRDSRGKPALRMAMQTREQHIRRDKATSNICTAQALLANIAAAYGIYHGPVGLKHIGSKVHAMAKVFASGVTSLGYKVATANYFDTVRIDAKPELVKKIFVAAASSLINLRLLSPDSLTISFDETTTAEHVNQLVGIFATASGKADLFDAKKAVETVDIDVPAGFKRTSEFLTHPIFSMFHSETDMLRYIFSLQSKDLSLQTAMIPLGSCTMKLNATSEMIPVTWPEVGRMHPFAPADQTKGYAIMIGQMEKDLATITGFHATSMQPNSGAQGEYAGLLAIRSYHRARGDLGRNVCLIPVSAHGTNPASAAMCNMKVVVIKCDDMGNIDEADLRAKVELHKAELAALMVTYPSTHGVFEENIKEVCALIHSAGGLVYMDGANMNAQVGLCSPGDMGADVCHLNLHKTFCIPHGGGGPGMGPIAVVESLAKHLPNHPLIKMGGSESPGSVCSAPWSSASILPISWMYLRMMGPDGLATATKMAILNANYMAKRLSKHFNILYTGRNNTCAHEFILDLREFKTSAGVVEEDLAKRLQDFNFHSPTMSWPVVGTLMVEPTESEPLYEMDRFCDAMITIRGEIAEIEAGVADRTNNVLKNAPHTADMVTCGAWDHPYSREKAVYPLPYLKANKFWPSVGRLDNVFGDRHVVCSCPPLESYSE